MSQDEKHSAGLVEQLGCFSLDEPAARDDDMFPDSLTCSATLAFTNFEPESLEQQPETIADSQGALAQLAIRNVNTPHDPSTILAALHATDINPEDPEQQAKTIAKSKPTLLGIPRELRNQIFEDVYQHYTALCDEVHMHLVPASTGSFAIIYGSPPPPKDTMLVCRQLSLEFRNMRTAAYRSFWTDNKFYVSSVPCLAEVCPSKPSSEPSTIDLQHIQHFVFGIAYWGARFVVPVDIKGKPSTTGIQALDQNAANLQRSEAAFNEEIPNRIADIVEDLPRHLTECREQGVSVGPEVEKGLDAENLMNLNGCFIGAMYDALGV